VDRDTGSGIAVTEVANDFGFLLTRLEADVDVERRLTAARPIN
jgi:hypothetical protein